MRSEENSSDQFFSYKQKVEMIEKELNQISKEEENQGDLEIQELIQSVEKI